MRPLDRRFAPLAALLALLAPAAPRTAAAAGGECKSVVLCDAIPRAKVDALCGTTSVSVVPVDGGAPDNVLTDTCEYDNAHHDGVAFLSRQCVGPVAGGATGAATLFRMMRAEAPRGSRQTDLAGVADEAYVRTSRDSGQAEIAARRGSHVFSVGLAKLSPEAVDAAKDKCLLPLMKELSAL
jgi:hypothetical protein